ncbi:hypothetical protein Micbo1qcDRAFT_110055, partial [Microdochium bolleyi]
SGLKPKELVEAARILARCLDLGSISYSISGGAANSLFLQSTGAVPRVTEDIDLVVQPADGITAEFVAKWLYTKFPEQFGFKLVYGCEIPVLHLTRKDKPTKDVEIEIFDVEMWPQRPQYDLSNSNNEVITLHFSGQRVNVFSGHWQLREKIVTAYERQHQQKHETDVADVESLLGVLPPSSNIIDLSTYAEAVQFVVDKLPQHRTALEFLVYCPAVLG